jgi:hypothetical protein
MLRSAISKPQSWNRDTRNVLKGGVPPPVAKQAEGCHRDDPRIIRSIAGHSVREGESHRMSRDEIVHMGRGHLGIAPTTFDVRDVDLLVADDRRSTKTQVASPTAGKEEGGIVAIDVPLSLPSPEP